MPDGSIGMVVPATSVEQSLSIIRQAESLGISSAWMTSGGSAGDPLTLMAVAAAQTERINVGTSILRIWDRHPITTARQAQVIAGIAPGRLRLGIGPSHQAGIESTFGSEFAAPLGHLREYLQIVRGLLANGAIEFDGQHYTARTSIGGGADVPVIASALRPRSFEVCGAEADGAISWVCPLEYLRNVALPAMKRGAELAGRATPPLFVHAPVCVHDDFEEARAGVRRQLGYFPSTPFYARMFATAGFADSPRTGWTDEMLDSVLIAGDENAVADRLAEVFAWGASEVVASVIAAGDDPQVSTGRTMRLLGEIASH